MTPGHPIVQVPSDRLVHQRKQSPTKMEKSTILPVESCRRVCIFAVLVDDDW